MAADQLVGGNDQAVVRVGGTVRRPVRRWSASVHELLRHLERVGFGGAPRTLGVDAQGREMLTYLMGESAGAPPWPAWAWSEDALVQTARWLRDYHAAVADYVPAPGARWRLGGCWTPGTIIAHNDAGPFNAAWHEGRLTGFFDWDFAGPVTPDSDVAWVAIAWVPLYARRVAVADGFGDLAARPERLRLFLDAYGWRGHPEKIVREAQVRMRARAGQIRRYGRGPDELYMRLFERGVADDLDQAVRELDDLCL
ncbi:phosphotransferase [Nonomuraea sp. NPDC005650]|uniref:phosphotransferase n=1 Tax=Nonomuraea sp. NPDC005650 TaxID=3157045 RepID=UPI0033B683C1